MTSEPIFDVCLSFAGEQRDYVRAVHTALTERGVTCFFDEPRRVELWGTDLRERFDKVYRKDAAFCVAFVSRHWVEKAWPQHERRSALARSLDEDGYFLPVRFDDADVPGLSPTVAFVDARAVSAEELAEMISMKVSTRLRHGYLPPYPDRLFAALRVAPGDERAQRRVVTLARHFLGDLGELSANERRIVIATLQYACPCGLPEDVHVDADRLRRCEQIPLDALREVVPTISSLPGFSLSLDEEADYRGRNRWLVTFAWEDMHVGAVGGKTTDVPSAMIEEAGTHACPTCHQRALERLDFSRTSSLLDRPDSGCAQSDLGDCHPALRPVAQLAFEAGWTIELTADQLRLRPPNGRDYVVADLSFLDDPDIEHIEREALERSLRRAGLDLTQHAGLSGTHR